MQLLRLDSTLSHSKCSDVGNAEAAATDVLLDAYGIGAIYANYKTGTAENANAEDIARSIFTKGR